MEERSNVGRNLDAIAVDIHQLERASVFEIGELLVEAEAACEHGEWRAWLKSEFEWSHDTARNYMNAARLVANDERVRHLRVPATIIYALADDVDEITPKLIDALVEATASGRRLSVSDADSIIIPAARRIKYGDHPEVAWIEMERVDGEPWGKAAIAALKAECPTTAKEAAAITRRVREAHKAGINAGEVNAGEVNAGEVNAGEHEITPAPAPKKRPDAYARNARQLFLKDCNDAAISAEAYEGPVDDEVLRECRRAADAWAALADKLEAAAEAKAA
jgi:hypothetical protein